MSDEDELEPKHSRNDAERLRQVKQWAEYVRTHPDEDWWRQVNKVVDAQIESARHHADETRPRNRGGSDE